MLEFRHAIEEFLNHRQSVRTAERASEAHARSTSLVAQRDETRAVAVDLSEQRRLAADSLRNVERLADVTELNSLFSEIEALNPPKPADFARIETWIERALVLRGRVPIHETRLESLRGLALPYSQSDREQDRRTNLELRSRIWTREWEGVLSTALEDSSPPLSPEIRSWARSHLAWARDRNEAEGEVPLDRRHTWRFARPALSWEHDQLSRLLRQAGDLSDSDHWSTLNHARRLLEVARVVLAASQPVVWKDAIAAIEESPRYGGLKISPQDGLTPLGEDPGSGLWEFGVVLPRLDEPQKRRPDGTFDLPTWCTVVLVLLPGGSFEMGSSDREEDGPPHEVSLEPFFISRYEVTQGAWKKVIGEEPSAYTFGTHFAEGEEAVTTLHPVENLTWDEARAGVRKLGLRLPTEAQWEYAARGGTASPWAWGDDSSQALRYANLRDRSYLKLSREPPGEPTDWSDGFPAHAVVGSFAPNAFGLHDVHGNVAEWVREGTYAYGIPRRASDGEGILISTAFKLHRGGSFGSLPDEARLDRRAASVRRTMNSRLGVRPARPLEGVWVRKAAEAAPPNRGG
ncbi:MAG: formylglycine-generating enzyme family protein [Planctomycetes bacterium]|nr:formylglycine-generating enzyme family protein [Planctomycetota bacterium]